MSRRWSTFAAAMFLMLLAWKVTAAQIEVRPFTPMSYASILKEHQGKPFLLVFWSLECPPCYQELKLLGELGAGRAFPAVVVSTDGVDAANQIAEVLERFGLEGVDARVFDGAPMPIRFAIDRTWYGELPRSYFFDAAHQRKAVTGIIDRDTIGHWMGR